MAGALPSRRPQKFLISLCHGPAAGLEDADFRRSFLGQLDPAAAPVQQRTEGICLFTTWALPEVCDGLVQGHLSRVTSGLA